MKMERPKARHAPPGTARQPFGRTDGSVSSLGLLRGCCGSRVVAPIALMCAFLVGVGSLVAPEARAGAREECFGKDRMRRIEACSRLLEQRISPATASLAYAMRALSYALLGKYERAITDYDKSIKINPDFAHALNNRAWAYFKMGRPQRGSADVERALKLAPRSPHAYDTRAHIHQSLGRRDAALRDYDRAIRYGGSQIIKLYQCGLQAHGLYTGLITGVDSEGLRAALETCVGDRGCDPLPPDEECRGLTS